MDDDAILAQYERSQQLQKEWEHLRDALDQVDRTDSDAPARLQAIRDRMAIITADMAAILHQTQSHSDAVARTNSGAAANAAPYRPPHYSARRRHIIQRTYSSTTDEDDVSPCPSLSSLPHGDPNASIPVLDSDQLDDQQLRRNLMRDAPHHPVITVEHDPAARPRFHLSEIKRTFKDKLRGAGSGSGSGGLSLSSPRNETPTTTTAQHYHNHHHHHRQNHAAAQPDGSNNSPGALPLPEPVDLATLTPLDEAVSPDSQSARTNRTTKSDRDFADDPLTPASVAHRLGAVSVGMERQSGSLSHGVAADAMMPATVAALPSASRGDAAGASKNAGAGPVSPVTNEAGSGDDEDGTGGARTMGPNFKTHAGASLDERNSSSHARSSNSNKDGAGKRRKGWQAIDSKIKALGRLTAVRKSMARAASMTMGPGSNVTPTSATGTPSGSGSGEDGPGLARKRSLRRRERESGNVFAETGERLAERGEKLTGVAEDSEQMASDAGDMLAAVRALRERKQARGRFG